MQKTLFGLRSGDRKKETATGPLWKQGYISERTLHVVMQCLLMLLILTNWEQSIICTVLH